jgi:chemotaxis methyl-accepting protein methylase
VLRQAPGSGQLKVSSNKFRHIVFADTLNFARKPLDLTPHDGRGIGRPLESDPHIFCADDRQFLKWLLERAGIRADAYREQTLSRRLAATLRAVRATSSAQGRTMIEPSDALLQCAISALLIGVSGFFRDQQVFDMLRDQVIPGIARDAGATIWSVGCSDGSEAYSVAMLLAEMRLLHRCSILGTDCRLQAIQAATGARYHAAATERQVPPRMLGRWFTRDRQSGHYVIDPLLRASVKFRCADVLTVQEPGKWDLILCRNMAMYMRKESVSRLWHMLETSLRPGGFLVLGRAERPDGASALSAVANCIYRRDKG